MIKSASQSSLTNDVKYRSMAAGAVPSNEYLIATAILPVDQNTVVFSNLNQWAGIYKDLKIVCNARNYTNVGSGGLNIRFNGSSSGYSYHLIEAVNGGVNFPQNSSMSVLLGGLVPHGATTGGVFGPSIIYITDAFSSTKGKTARISAGNLGYYNYAWSLSSYWNNTAPINEILFSAALDGNYFTGGTRFSIYGVTA